MNKGLSVAVVLAVLAFAAVSAREVRYGGPRGMFGVDRRGWIERSRVAPAHTVNLVFAIANKNVDQLDSILMSVSDPTSPDYGKHLSLEQVTEMFASQENADAVRSYLLEHGVHADQMTLTASGDFLQVSVPASVAEELLSAEFYHFVHPETGAKAVRARSYTLAEELEPVVDFVSATGLMPSTRPSLESHQVSRLDAATVAKGGIPSGYVGPKTIFDTYGVTNPKVATQDATQSVYENLGQSYAPDDLSKFQSTFGLPDTKIVKVIGPNDPSACTSNPNNCVEADLDVQYIMAVAQDSPTTYWSIANSDQQPFLDWIMAVASDSNAPLVHSISYGDIEEAEDPTMLQRFNTELGKVGARGISVFIASGDDGVANFQARNDPSQCGFHPSFPATAPYATAVGATQGPEASQPEVACTSSTGGGITVGSGFSTVFSMPSYQSSAVQNYLSSVSLPPSGSFNAQGRAYPDISALGHNYITVVGGQTSAGSGTSASTPVVAAMVTLINAQRLSAGKSALGFLNPAIYQMSSDNFNDITSGYNNCCAGQQGSQTCCQYGFYAASGYDVITGFGSPKFQSFANTLMNL